MSIRLIVANPREQPSLEAVLAAVADRRDSVALDVMTARYGQCTLVAFDPVEVLSRRWGDDDPFESLQAHLRSAPPLTPTSPNLDHWGQFLGWIGYFAYEAGRYIERLPATTAADLGLPVARFGFYDSAALHIPPWNRWLILLADHETARRPWSKRQQQWEELLRTAASRELHDPPSPSGPVDNMTRAEYLQMVVRAREYIAAGDVFQVNLARRETFAHREPGWQTYLRLRRVNPAAHSAFLSWNDDLDDRACAIVSASPELFLHLFRGKVVSRPIKGTRPRSGDPQRDQALAAELACSRKDRAELAMIVDLVRNDLGRVCEYGSVRVAADRSSAAYPYVLETHPTVHHLVATVTGRLAAGRDPIDLVRACFPGGSITGAPKVRAMEIIDELEPTQRSVYTGSIGIFGLDGSMTLNIAIRTMIVAGDRIHIHAGGGIVADSVPEDEYQETCAKAVGMRRALGITEGLEA